MTEILILFNCFFFKFAISTPVSTTGRKRDAIWIHFDLFEDGKKAKSENGTEVPITIVAPMKERF